MQVLIAEDDITTRLLLSNVLSKNGYTVIEVADGNAALEVLEKEQFPDLAIIDWMMPGMEGVDVIRRIRELHPSPPPYLMLLTHRENKQDIIEGLKAGANDYLPKPFDIGELLARLEVGKHTVELQRQLVDTVNELHRTMSQLQAVSGIVPICSTCRKKRDDSSYWTQVEEFINNHPELNFKTGMCIDCVEHDCKC